MRFVWLIGVLATAAVGLATVAGSQQPPQPQPQPAVAASAVDGDTLEIGRGFVQLAGIDAPELGQRCMNGDKTWRCGLDAALALKKLISFGPVTCTQESVKAGRIIGSCASERRDIAEVLLQQGYALALPDAPPGYLKAEAAAREAKLGVWRGDFIPPWQWRDGKRLPGQPVEGDVCVIKGVITAQNQRVFYIPTDEEYEKITIDPAKGERMFCSDDEAVLGGWKRFPRPSAKPQKVSGS